MSEVLAVTTIRHGNEDGSVTEFRVGDDVSELGDEAVQALIDVGSAVEFGSNKQYNANPDTAGAGEAYVDKETLLRDQLLARAKTEGVVTDATTPKQGLIDEAPPPAPGGSEE